MKYSEKRSEIDNLSTSGEQNRELLPFAVSNVSIDMIT